MRDEPTIKILPGNKEGSSPTGGGFSGAPSEIVYGAWELLTLFIRKLSVSLHLK